MHLPLAERGKGEHSTKFSDQSLTGRLSFGADPFLSGEGAYETISGIQSQGVQAVAKHFINK